jgi:hypothetical protein
VKRNLIALAAVAFVLAVTTGAVAAQRYLITSSSQIKPGVISYANLSTAAKDRLAEERGARAATGLASAAGANALAQASGLLAWTADPAQILVEAHDTSGSIHGTSVVLTRGQVVSKLAELVVAPGVGTNHGMFALYDGNLALVAKTADTPAAFQVANQWVELPLTSPYTVPATGLYYFVDLVAATTTTPTIGMVGLHAATDARSTLPGGVPRNVHGGPGLSAFPATLVNDGTGVTRSIVAR